MTTEQEKTLEDAAYLIAGNHGSPLAAMLFPLFVTMAKSHSTAGGNARATWLKALRALGKTCLTVEEMVNNK